MQPHPVAGDGVRSDAGSFRDPHSRVFYANGEVYRALSGQALTDWEALTASGLLDARLPVGEVVATEPTEMNAADFGQLLPQGAAAVLRHERIPFISYPYEWSFEMLRDAARLQLELLLAALERGLILKDATPYNVQWRGSRPVFVDIGSFEPYVNGQPWAGYRQFCMLYLYPLMLRAYRDVPFHPLLRGSLDGISPSDFDHLLPRWTRLRRGVLKHVYLHAKLERRYAAAGGEVRTELKRAGFGAELIKANVTSLLRLVERLKWKPGETPWAQYGTINEYGPADVEAKRRFVETAAASRKWQLAWDLGCNDGSYSKIAAAHADATVAVDGAENLIDDIYRERREAGAGNILPLVVDLADPSPSLGWRGRERSSLEGRAKPDLVLCLALVHHLAITKSIPPESFLEWLRSLDASVVIEFVTLDDPMGKLLASRKPGGVHPGYDKEPFQQSLQKLFEIQAREEICEGRRILYFVRPRV